MFKKNLKKLKIKNNIKKGYENKVYSVKDLDDLKQISRKNIEIDQKLDYTISLITEISKMDIGYALYATFLILLHFDVICDQLLNRRTAT